MAVEHGIIAAFKVARCACIRRRVRDARRKARVLESARREKEQKEKERERSRKRRETVMSMCKCAFVCVALREGERVVKPRLRIYDIELEVRRAGPEVGANKI